LPTEELLTEVLFDLNFSDFASSAS